MPITSKELLIDYIDSGNGVDYLFFWGQEEQGSQVTRACLCQWYAAGFDVNGVHYKTAEHFMMAEKASLFSDETMYTRIIASPEPGDAKVFGRHVKGYDDARWREHRFDVVIAGNVAKFSQNPPLAQFLLGTGERMLIEASPFDTIWGVGMAESHPGITDPHQWRGRNLLGFALMSARESLLKQPLQGGCQ